MSFTPILKTFQDNWQTMVMDHGTPKTFNQTITFSPRKRDIPTVSGSQAAQELEKGWFDSENMIVALYQSLAPKPLFHITMQCTWLFFFFFFTILPYNRNAYIQLLINNDKYIRDQSGMFDFWFSHGHKIHSTNSDGNNTVINADRIESNWNPK